MTYIRLFFVLYWFAPFLKFGPLPSENPRCGPGTTLLFLQSSGNVPCSSIVLESNFSGKAIDFPHACIIRIDISSQSWALLG